MPTELNTPNLNLAFKTEAQGLVEDGLQKLNENWMNREAKGCKQCKGKGKIFSGPDDLVGEHCIACDGTGVDMYVEYGVEDGKFVARVIQNGAEAIAELCKEYREEETRLGVMGRAARTTMKPFLLPEAVRYEMELKEPDFSNMIKEGEYKKASNLVRRHYPEYMTTNYIF